MKQMHCIRRIQFAELYVSHTALSPLSNLLIQPIIQQFYISCLQVHIDSTSDAAVPLPAGVEFPGAYTDTTPGIQFNIYTQPATSYVAPPPAVWSDAEGGSIALVGLVEVNAITPTPERRRLPRAGIKVN